MPNLYVTVDQLKESAPDALRSSNTDYDEIFYKLAGILSRWVDNTIQRAIFPIVETRFFSLDRSGRPFHREHHAAGLHHGHGLSGGFGHDIGHGLGHHTDDDLLWIDDLIEEGTISISEDDGQTFTALTSSDFIAMQGFDFNFPGSFNLLKVDVNSTVLSTWPRGQKAIRVADATWGFTEDRTFFFEDTLDTVQDNPLSSSATTLTVSDIDGLDKWGITPRISRGQILRIESEFLEVTAVNATGNTATVVRGVNGTTAAAHAQNIQVDKFLPPDPIMQATLIQAIRQFKRGQTGFGEAEALPDLGRIVTLKTIDPEALALLERYRRLGFE